METRNEKWFEGEEYHKENFLTMWEEAKKRMSEIEERYKEGDNIFIWKNVFNEIKDIEQMEANRYLKEKLKYMKPEDLFAVRLCAGPLLANEAEKKKFGFTYSIE